MVDSRPVPVQPKLRPRLLRRHYAPDLHFTRVRRRRFDQLVRPERDHFNLPTGARAGGGPGHRDPVLLWYPVRPGLHGRPGLLPAVPAGPVQVHGWPGPLYRLPHRNLRGASRLQQLRRLPHLPHGFHIDRRELQLFLRRWLLRCFHKFYLSSLRYRNIPPQHCSNQLYPVQPRILRVLHGFHILRPVPTRLFTEFHGRLVLRSVCSGLLSKPVRRSLLHRLFHRHLRDCPRLLRRMPAGPVPTRPRGLLMFTLPRRRLLPPLRVRLRRLPGRDLSGCLGLRDLPGRHVRSRWNLCSLSNQFLSARRRLLRLPGLRRRLRPGPGPDHLPGLYPRLCWFYMSILFSRHVFYRFSQHNLCGLRRWNL